MARKKLYKRGQRVTRRRPRRIPLRTLRRGLTQRQQEIRQIAAAVARVQRVKNRLRHLANMSRLGSRGKDFYTPKKKRK